MVDRSLGEVDIHGDQVRDRKLKQNNFELLNAKAHIKGGGLGMLTWLMKEAVVVMKHAPYSMFTFANENTKS